MIKNSTAEFDGLRGIAAAMVALWHWFSMGRMPHVLFLDIRNSLFAASEIAVSTFFVLSGTVLTISVLRAEERGGIDLGNYYLRRMARIFPLVFFVVLISYAGMWLLRHGLEIDTQWRRYSNFDANILVRSLLTLNNHFIPPGWTLKYELIAYIFLPLLVLLALSLHRKVFDWIFLAIGLFAIFIAIAPIDLPKYPKFLCMFVPGVYLGFKIFHRELNFSTWAYLFCGIMTLCFSLYLGAGRYDYSYLTAISAALVLAAASTSAGNISGFLSAKRLRSLGDISYGVYLLHYPILWSLFYLLGSYVGTKDFHIWLIVGLIGLPLTIWSSYLSFRFIEQPVISWAAQRSGRSLSRSGDKVSNFHG